MYPMTKETNNKDTLLNQDRGADTAKYWFSNTLPARDHTHMHCSDITSCIFVFEPIILLYSSLNSLVYAPKQAVI